jgi:hypothetical protein
MSVRGFDLPKDLQKILNPTGKPIEPRDHENAVRRSPDRFLQAWSDNQGDPANILEHRRTAGVPEHLELRDGFSALGRPT